jgi:hypothetical protein
MLEQSRVRIAGVVFNGMYEDLENWSSYGPNDMIPGELLRGPSESAHHALPLASAQA